MSVDRAVARDALTIEFGAFAEPTRTSRLSPNLTSSDHHNNSVLLSTENAVMGMLAAEVGSEMEVDDFQDRIDAEEQRRQAKIVCITGHVGRVEDAVLV